MKYKEKLLDLILHATDDELIQWIESQPLIEQSDIFRELKEIAEDAAAEVGDDVNEEIAGFESFSAQIDHYEEIILDEKLAEANLVMATEEQEKAMAEMTRRMDGIRNYIIDCIVTNAPNAKDMLEAAKGIIELEKKNGFYEPENWKALEERL